MSKIRLTTSLWTTPMFEGRWNIDSLNQFKNTLLMCALCVTYAKKNGAHITMHTDDKGYEILSKFGYDEIFSDLNELDNTIKTSSTVMWAGGKIIALENEPLGTIHIDNDVFITKSECIENMIERNTGDFIFQHVETTNYKEQKIFKDIITNTHINKDYACCVGIIGFNSEEARKIYIDNYRYWFNNLEFDKNGDNNINADLIVEQLFLYNMMDDMGFIGNDLIGDLRVETVFSVQRKSSQIGYKHYIGRVKHDPSVINMFRKDLKRLNPNLLEIIDNYDC